MPDHDSGGWTVEIRTADGSTERLHQAPGSGTQRLKSVGAAAEYLGVSRATVERLVYRGELPIVKVGGSTRYDVADLDGYIATNRTRNRKLGLKA